MPESYKKSNYVNIVRSAVPELALSNVDKTNHNSLIQSKEFPLLKHVVLLSENKHPGMLNWESDVIKKAASCSLTEMVEREATLSFEDVVNI